MEENHEAHEMALGPVGRLERYLDERGVDHELIEHDETMTARAEAREAGVEPDDMAKAVVLTQGERHLLAVIPASQRLDLGKVGALVGEAGLRIADEAELKALVPDLELGALPPLGPDLPAAELIDQRLLGHERIVCNAGDHRHSVRLSPGAILELADPIVADLCVQ